MINNKFLILQEYAKNKNGKLLSLEYKTNNIKLIWECEKGHQWKARWYDVNYKNTWCSECSHFKTEISCRKLLEQKLNIILNKTKIKINHKWYEFDGYNKECKIAFEYHGIQHYKYPNYWYKTREEFEAALQRDKEKENYCKKNNIQLIIIPYYERKNIETFIANIADSKEDS